jgi:hypothetical protein
MCCLYLRPNTKYVDEFYAIQKEAQKRKLEFDQLKIMQKRMATIRMQQKVKIIHQLQVILGIIIKTT